MSSQKRIPYGISDFLAMRRENYYYVDKTQYIPLLEQAGKYLLFLRPRRFGKSLWLSVLDCYYDLARRDDFDSIFSGTSIHDHPTDEHNTYLILSFNFSGVNPDRRHVEESFEFHVREQTEYFRNRYTTVLPEGSLDELQTAGRSFERVSHIIRRVKEAGQRLYVLIDEYDNFANTILSSSGEKSYHDLTHGQGFFRYFFNVLKAGTTGSGASVARLFITGVSPVTMDDVTSGFNIGTNVTLDGDLSGMLGFTDGETDTLLEYYGMAGLLKEDTGDRPPLLHEWYGNYRFSPVGAQTVYNSDMVLYAVGTAVRTGSLPLDLVDPNVKTDYRKLRHLVMIDRRLNGSFSRLKEIAEGSEIATTLQQAFPAERLLNPDVFLSLLYYLGLLTIGRRERGQTVLRIPNLTVRSLFYEYLREGYKDVDIFRLDVGEYGRLISRMAYAGEWEPVLDYLAKALREQTSIRDYIEGETALRAFLLAYLNITDLYITRSEVEMNKGFADIYFQPLLAKYPDIAYSYLLELKYVRRGELTEELLRAMITEATEQLSQYAQEPFVQATAGATNLRKLVAVFHGWELVHREECHAEHGRR